MENQEAKKQIRKLLFRAFKGKITLMDWGKVWEKVKDYEVEDWKKLKIIVKSVIKEWWDEEVQPYAAVLVGDDLKGEVKNLVHALIDLKFAIFNENVFYKVVQLGKRNDLNDQQKLISAFFSLVPEVKKITSQRPRLADYHKTETVVIEKYSKLTSKFFKKEADKVKEVARWKEINRVLESTSNDEIIILEKKLKLLALSSFDKIEKRNLPGFAIKAAYKEPFKLVLDLIETIFKPEMVKDAFALLKKVGKASNGNYKLEFLLEKALEIGNPELKKLLITLTNHVNKLIDGIPDEQISPAETELVLDRAATNIQQVLPSTPPPESPGDPNPVQNLLSTFTSLSQDPDFMADMESEAKKEFSTVRSQEQKSWYKDPWKVGSLAVLGTIAIGLIGWLIFRKRNNRANYA